MGGTTVTTTFVTGSEGFLGVELIRLLVALGHRVVALTAALEHAETLHRLGAVPALGDPRIPGRWQDLAAAELVIHLPLAIHRRRRVLERRTAETRLSLDAARLDAVSSRVVRRIVYVADGSCYGAAGARPLTEDDAPRPSAAGRWQVPALERLNRYVQAGWPIVTAIPGCVFGHRSWFRRLVMEPVAAGRRVLQFGRTGPLVSPVHVHDCVRALVHLAEHGRSGGRYFVANSTPARLHEFASTFARLAERPLRVRRLPAAAGFLVRRRWPDYPESDAVLSNIRLRASGFRFAHPTLEHGIAQALRDVHDQTIRG